ncbi:PEP-CTERM sorting domain-containing protein [Zooshikella ganghwensis]|uniref:PEP-CTERM sorting domain-containing protein n=1 Tax=Zooshikella ganghwensis TaxID=202772 RepID=A0A4P9VN83_9GAMM|nr:PEP-CTERM sorting domain-containing protein [Zooshikella ganghwensis]RDH43864.1 PEP-CTERM sorting domain-containing protein [Zooshikella ganghwensis]
MRLSNITKLFTVSCLAAAVNTQAGILDFSLVDGSGIFQNATVGGGTFVAPTIITDTNFNGGLDVFSQLSWGEPIGDGDQSNLQLVSHKSVAIEALNTPYELSVITHNNNVLNGAFATLATAQILGALSMSSTLGAGFQSAEIMGIPLAAATAAVLGDADVPDDLVMPADYGSSLVTLFDIAFNETLNAGDCPFGNPRGSICDDFFTLTTDSGFPVTLDIMIDDMAYELFIYSSFDADGSTIELGPDYFTAENAATNLYTFARLTKVPEPTSVALLSLGLLLASRRKLKN